MARYRQSNFEVFLKTFGRFPPFITAPLGLIGFIICNQITRVEQPKLSLTEKGSAAMSGLQDMFFITVLKGWAYALQFVIPFMMAMCVLFWFCNHLRDRYQASKDARLYDRVARSPERGALHEMSWQEFERVVGRAFSQNGYQVVHTGRVGADGGVDLVLKRGSEVSLVQCKHWKATKVSVQKVRELFGLMAERGAAAAFLVSAGSYTSDAAKFASGKNITLVTGDQLLNLIRRGSPTDAASNDMPQEKSQEAAACPDCGHRMVKRVARKGVRAGLPFLGCSRYPGCHGVRELQVFDAGLS